MTTRDGNLPGHLPSCTMVYPPGGYEDISLAYLDCPPKCPKHITIAEAVRALSDLSRSIPEPVEYTLDETISRGIEIWFAKEVRELHGPGDPTDTKGEAGYPFSDYLEVLNRKCPGVLTAILKAGAASQVEILEVSNASAS